MILVLLITFVLLALGFFAFAVWLVMNTSEPITHRKYHH